MQLVSDIGAVYIFSGPIDRCWKGAQTAVSGFIGLYRKLDFVELSVVLWIKLLI